ncbi:MAG: uracil phosphoribosyltransferase, partial [Chthoniobacteraceae bacterium]
MSESVKSWPGVTVISHPLVRAKLTRMRAAGTCSSDFRRHLAELAALMVYEVTRDLATEACTIETPLESCAGTVLRRPIIIAPILRAGLGMVEGMLRLLPEAS